MKNLRKNARAVSENVALYDAELLNRRFCARIGVSVSQALGIAALYRVFRQSLIRPSEATPSPGMPCMAALG